jgi:hypothetical protein
MIEVRFEVFTAVTMKNAVFWDVMPFGSCKNRRFVGRSASTISVTRIDELGTLRIEELRSSETLILIRVTRRNIGGILQR